MSFHVKNPISPPAHKDTVCTIWCGPISDALPAHGECTGWLALYRGRVQACECWCHQRQRAITREHDEVFPENYCSECEGPYLNTPWLMEQYDGHWDTCPNRPNKGD